MKLPLFFIIFFLILIPVLPVHAAIIPNCALSGSGGICCALLLVSNLARWILGIMGAVALGFFIYGGFLWITAVGQASKVEAGRKLMTNTVIGIIIIIFAWTAVNFVITSFTGTGQITFDNKVDLQWYELCKNQKVSLSCQDVHPTWDCVNINTCSSGINNYDDCTSQNNCQKYLCSGNETNVCCK